jgi:membrane protein
VDHLDLGANGPRAAPPGIAATIGATCRYVLSLECHVYAFSVAANVLLSFFPFLVLVLTLANVFHWQAAGRAIYVGLKDFLPEDPGLVDFVLTNLRASVESPGRGQVVSALMLLFSSNGIFVPLEVALNRIWGFTEDRSYWRNQVMSLGLAIACGILVLAAALLTSRNMTLLNGFVGQSVLPETTMLLALRLAAVPFSIVGFALVYWVLPNGPIPFRQAALSAVISGLALEAAKHAYLLAWPYLGFRHAYGPFFISVTVVIWGYVAAMIVLAGGRLGVEWGQSSSPSTNH